MFGAVQDLQPISPIRVSPNGRYFVDKQGAPVFWLGDTQWELFRRFTPDDALHVLRDRQAKGFNVILVMLLGVDTAHFGGDPGESYVNLDGERPWVGGDPLCPNERYFQHIDAMIRLGERTGQVFVVGVYHQWQAKTLPWTKARPWAQWVARRYREVPNLIWSMYPEATADFVPVCRELAAGLQDGDGGAHLICVHPDPAVASSSFLHDEPWLAFNMIQTCTRYEEMPRTVAADYQRSPAKPVVMAEGGYEGVEFGKRQTAHHIRKQAYWTQLSGGYHVYGHNESWQHPRDWDRWLDSPGSRDLQVFKEAITSLDTWWEMVPDASIMVADAGSGDAINTAARSKSGRWAVVYLGEPCALTVRLDAITASDGVVVRWVDPRTGEHAAVGRFPASGAQRLTPPESWQDALLVVEAD